MTSFKYLTCLWLLWVPLWVSVTTTAAQPATCEPVVEDALAVAGESCSELAHNTACYGHTRVQAAFRETDAEVIFGSPADQVEVALVEQMQTSAYDEASGEWGVAVMNVQADVPDTLPGQGVIFLLLGEAQVLDGAAGRVDRDPMQAFYFSGGIGPAACRDAPNTLAIRSPEPDGERYGHHAWLDNHADEQHRQHPDHHRSRWANAHPGGGRDRQCEPVG
jgi:hypothetical protein